VGQSPFVAQTGQEGPLRSGGGIAGGCRLRGRSRPVEVVRDVIACKLLAGRRSNGRR
jgi:hypothetical protein